MQLRWYQTEAVDACYAAIRRRADPCIVLPTGAGKSLVIAEIARLAYQQWNGRILIVAHRKELLQQNAAKIRLLLPGVDVGVYSAGLGCRDTQQSIVLGGIQSIYQRAHEFERRDLLIVDESHLVPVGEQGMFRKLIADVRAGTPHCRLVGLTATPFRMDCGLITDDGVFSEICYEASVSRLMQDGFLSKVVNSPTHEVDVSQVKIIRGEYAEQQLEETFLREVSGNVAEALRLAEGRKSVLWFCSGVHHAHKVADEIGSDVGCVTGETTPLERANLLERFASGSLRHLVNCDVLTTGFDAPNIDCIVVLRATQSAGLFAQIVGRGFRIADGKQDCLVLDYGGNVSRHGPLDAPDYGRRKRVSRESTGEILAPRKNCPQCDAEILAVCVWCPECGHEMPRDNKLEETADTESKLLEAQSEPEWLYVIEANVYRHSPKKVDKQRSLRVDYTCQREGGGNLSEQIVSEWVCLEHEGFARRKSESWWRLHCVAEPPDSIDDAYELWRLGAMRMPSAVQVVKDGRWWRVLDRQFVDELPEEWAEEYVEFETEF